MLDRVESDKVKVTYHISRHAALLVTRRASELGKTKSRYIDDLVLLEVAQHERDITIVDKTAGD